MGLLDLFRPKWKHSDSKVRRNAVEKLNNGSILAGIAKADKDPWVRAAAVRNPNLTDQILFEHIVKNDEDTSVRYAAIEKITDQMLLTFIAKNDVSLWVRFDAAEKITNQNVAQTIFAHIVKNAEDDELIKKAIKKLTNYDLLDTKLSESKRKQIYKDLKDRIDSRRYSPKADYLHFGADFLMRGSSDSFFGYVDSLKKVDKEAHKEAISEIVSQYKIKKWEAILILIEEK